MKVVTILTATVAISFAVAFAFEWLCLRSVMALMPMRRLPPQSARLATQSKQD
jgi:hypothetical protein